MDYDIHAFVASSSTEDMPPCPMSSFPADMSAASEQQTYQQIDELDAELILLEQLINENQAAIQHLVQLDQKEQAMLCDLEQSVAHLQQEVRGVGAVFKPSSGKKDGCVTRVGSVNTPTMPVMQNTQATKSAPRPLRHGVRTA
jgi:hypothetical protein